MSRRELLVADEAIRRRDGERQMLAMDAATFPWADESGRRAMIDAAQRLSRGIVPGCIDRTDSGTDWDKLRAIVGVRR